MLRRPGLPRSRGLGPPTINYASSQLRGLRWWMPMTFSVNAVGVGMGTPRFFYGNPAWNGNDSNGGIEPTARIDEIGQSYTFTGGEAFLHTGVSDTPPVLPPNSQHATITAWVRPSTLAVYKGIVGSRGGSTLGLLVSGAAGGTSLGYLWQNSGSDYDVASGLTFTLDRWQFVSCSIWPNATLLSIWDAANGFRTFRDTQAHAAKTLDASMAVGRDPGGSFWQGGITDVRLYDRPLEVPELLDIATIRRWELYGPARRLWVDSIAGGGGGGNVTSLPPAGSLAFSSTAVTRLVSGGAIPVALKNTYRNAILDSRPYGYWRLGETSGLQATDDSTHMHHGTYVNTPALGQTGLITGDNNKAVDFDQASSEYVDLGIDAAYTPVTGGFTLEAWVKPLRTFVNSTTYDVFGNELVDNYGIRVWLESNHATTPTAGRVRVRFNRAGANSFVETGFLASLMLNTAAMIAVTYDGRYLRVLVNGVLAAGPTLVQRPVQSEISTRIAFGALFGTSKFNGVIDEVAVFTRKLHDSLVAKHYASRAQISNQPAHKYSRANFMRAGATRSNYFLESLVATIGGVSVGNKFTKRKTMITKILNDQPDRASAQTFDIEPLVGQEIIISNGSIDNRLFGGVIISRSAVPVKHIDGVQVTELWDIQAADWLWQLGNRRVLKRYPLQPAHQIAIDLAVNYAAGYSTAGIKSGAPEVAIDFSYETTVASAFQQLANRIDWKFNVDAYKKIRFFDIEETVSQPKPISASNLSYDRLAYNQTLSQIRTRVLVEGGGGKVTAPVASGETSIPVDECGWYLPGECDLLSGPQRITFTGRSATSGPGNLTGIPASGTGAILYPLLQGDDVNILVQEDDTVAQTALAAAAGGDGIREYFITDRRLSVSTCRERALGELALFSTAVVSGGYESQDNKIEPGTVATIDLPLRGLEMVQVINEVDIWFETPNRTRRRAKFTSAVKIDLSDIIRSVGNTQA